MDAGAEVAGVTIQLCMAFPRHALQTVEMGQATQIRASQDHAPELGGQYGNLQVRSSAAGSRVHRWCML